MDDATVPHIDLWGFGEAFACVGVKGRQPSYQQKIGQQIDVTRDRGELMSSAVARRDAFSVAA